MDKVSYPRSQARNTKPAKPQRRITRFAFQAILSAAARQRENLPPDSPRVRPTLPALRFLREAAE
jgi:hypothetical protein